MNVVTDIASTEIYAPILSDAEPLMLDRRREDALKAIAGKALAVIPSDAVQSDADNDFWDAGYSRIRPYSVLDDGTLVIPMKGVLVPNFPFAVSGFFGAVTGYAYLTEAFNRAASDDRVKRVIIDCDSPGGYVKGIYETRLALDALNAKKTVTVVVNELCASAAIHLASGASEIVAVPTAELGSIGVLWKHYSFSGMNERMGVKVTKVTAGTGKGKTDSDFDLSDEAEAEMQRLVNVSYERFVSAVAKGRDLKPATIKGFGAAIFAAEEAVENGLADRVARYADVMSAASENGQHKEKSSMTDKTEIKAEAASEQTAAAAPAKTYEDGSKDASARIQAILDSDEAKGREASARHLAFATAMSADEAKELLATIPAAAQAAADDASKLDAGAKATGAEFDKFMTENASPAVKPAAEASDGDELLKLALESMKGA